jgi:hypothetical protein
MSRNRVTLGIVAIALVFAPAVWIAVDIPKP